MNDEIVLSWNQYFRHTKEEVCFAIESVFIIKEKILQLEEKKKKIEDVTKIQKQINRLEISKESIKYYYQIELNL